jgi:hypothetical protein
VTEAFATCVAEGLRRKESSAKENSFAEVVHLVGKDGSGRIAATQLNAVCNCGDGAINCFGISYSQKSSYSGQTIKEWHKI